MKSQSQQHYQDDDHQFLIGRSLVTSHKSHVSRVMLLLKLVSVLPLDDKSKRFEDKMLVRLIPDHTFYQAPTPANVLNKTRLHLHHSLRIICNEKE